ncbi:CLUMA_CG005035, isoform A [Clunio marinus]|uniref:Polypeptide N-acetylgalactosaminyltransferase n=1 Tax=Clunio marinus TaxID=568069 RepID=A0A1J1HUZ0_9DIPT|nr:CLUMA_CG005035, isoform A [Clunio marinus]
MLPRFRRVIIFPFIFFLFLTFCGVRISNDFKPHYGEPRRYAELKNYELKDWHDYEFKRHEATRVGEGENGTAVHLTDPKEIEANNEMFEIEGLNVIVSDKISVNRSLPDVRHEKCRTALYLKNLPKVSIVVIFHNEYPSIVKRTLHSIHRRTPAELLWEIILVNDASTKDELYEPLQSYVRNHFDGKVKILNLKERVGLIVARMEGAKLATADVLVFFDSHVEVNVNWLPPLIEPIAINPRACTTPIIDRFNAITFEHEVYDDFGVRGLIAWDFDYRTTYQSRFQPTKPKPTPIMLGCAFAINRQYFWDLGAYDDQLLIWNAENYELSFKLWLCGGELLECPCSRVAHVFRYHNIYRELEGVDFVARNFKRIAEVWMDDWKQYLYKTDEDRFNKVDPGDLTKQKMIRENLNCKPFDYFMHQIAPEILKLTPIPRPEDVGFGVLRAFVKSKSYCISDFNFRNSECNIGEKCDKSLIAPHTSQYFHVNRQGIVEHERTKTCFDKRSFTHLSDYKFQTNSWKYDFENQRVVHSNGMYCISINVDVMNINLIECNANDETQRWMLGYVNKTILGEDRNTVKG